MRKLTRTLLLLVVALAAFAGGVYAAVSGNWLQPVVRVHVENASGQELRSLHVAYTGYQVKGQIEALPPRPGTSTTVHFFHQGEGGCQVNVTLADGKVLQGICGYIEPGYSLAFKVTPSALVGGLSGRS